MNKHYTYSEWLKECNTYEDTYKKYFELQKETDELWVRIDKAIEYINQAIENGEYFEDEISTDVEEANYDKYVNANDLLEILKGDM